MQEKYLVAWDFAKKPSGSFYRLMHSEFGDSHTHGDFELIQRSVAVCRDDFTACRLAELAEHFGAQVAYYTVTHEGIPSEGQREAREFLSRVLQRRLKQRGQKRNSGKLGCR